MARTDCTLVTCDAFPALDPDDRLLAGELRRRGLRVAIAVWSDPAVDWSAGRLTVLRSTWDYHRRHAEFVAWLDRIAPLTTVRNAPPLIKWNAHKFYLRDLELRGIPVVPTAWLTQGTRCRLTELCASRGWDPVVIKPALGAASHDVVLAANSNGVTLSGAPKARSSVTLSGAPKARSRRAPVSLDEAQAHLDALLAGEDALVQPYLQSVETYGERALMFVRDRYSHAVAKEPFDTVLAV
ncbi:MAG TPA: hypothetical protein VFU90_11730, partial [Candidatus Tumulicola sp.]|nr:hypothetical protein [Candidatus Tumulicola sp.]